MDCGEQFSILIDSRRRVLREKEETSCHAETIFTRAAHVQAVVPLMQKTICRV